MNAIESGSAYFCLTSVVGSLGKAVLYDSQPQIIHGAERRFAGEVALWRASLEDETK